MVRRKLVGIGLFATLFFTAFSSVSFAGEWKQDDKGWTYVDDFGSVATDRWAKSGERWYYLGSDSYMLTDSFFESNNNLYYVDADGVMLANAWKQIQDESGESHWYYFGSNGAAFRNSRDKFYPKTVGDKKYGFNADGQMLVGFVNEEGDVLTNSEDGYEFLSSKYYFGEDGALYTGRWVLASSTFAPDKRSELGMKDYSNYDEIWLYYDNNGKLVKAVNGEKTKVVEINGKKYAFDENGVMIPDFSLNNLNVRATSSNANKRLANGDADGSLIADRWTWAVPTDVIDEEEFDLQEYSWWRTDANGQIIKNKIADVYGRKYAFDAYGRMQAGFVIMLENGKFGIKYDVDEWNREDFLLPAASSVIPSIDRGNLYIFNSDEFNDGSMLRGGEFEITLNDTTATFGVAQNGKVFGNRSTLQRVNSKYYYNGLRLDANDDIGYGIVDINTGSGTDYVVVNSNGNIVKGRRVLKDRQGYWIVVQNGRFVARLDDTDAPRWRNGAYWRYDRDRRGSARYVSTVTPSLDNVDEDFLVFEH